MNPETKQYYDSMGSTGGQLALVNDHPSYTACSAGFLLDNLRKRVVPTFQDDGITFVNLEKPDHTGNTQTEAVPLALVILEAFVRPYEPGDAIRFRDGDKTNHKLKNLYYLPRTERA